MKVAEKFAKTVEEAIQDCLSELGVKREQVTIEVLEKPKRKVFSAFLAIINLLE